ncbi:MAG: hypothetical protein AB7N91_28215 [Candidatus Tectimicrobiota bacterium]
MSKPLFELTSHGDETFYAFIGRVSLRLVEQNVDAITAANFLRELAEAGGSLLGVEQARRIAQNYVTFASPPAVAVELGERDQRVPEAGR